MNNTELSNYILHYVENDKTGRAIMLNGEWGIGKSYYIQNILRDGLKKKGYKCVVVSLYEQNSLGDISKSIFWEVKNSNLDLDTDNAKVGLLVAKTILKGVTSHFGIDISVENEDLLSIYRSLDLSKTLIVFEDFERSNIDIISILGFINTLVEKDEAKVLIVANEAEIIKTEYKEVDLKKDKRAITDYTESTKRYLSYKEKTVLDTINYTGDYKNSVKSILKKYKLDNYYDDINEIADDIYELMISSNNYNLRSIIFSCQKAKDIFDITGQLGVDYKKCILYGIIYYSFKITGGNRPKWSEGNYYSAYLGSYSYPLFRFAYDYINNQIIDKELIEKTEKYYYELKQYEKNISDANENLKIISSWWNYYDKDIKNAVKKLEHDLEKKDIIPLDNYGRIAHYIIAIKYWFGSKIDIERIKVLLVSNLLGKGAELSRDILLISGFTDEDKEYRQEVKDLMGEMLASLDSSDLQSFNYSIDEVNEFYNKIKKEGTTFTYKDGFAKKLNVQKLVDMYFKCSPGEMGNFRGAFIEIYKGQNTELYNNDKENINAFLGEVKKRLGKEQNIDITKKVHTIWLIDRIENYINHMESLIQ